MKIRLITLTTILLFIFAACEYDNFDEPKSVLTGRVVYNGVPVGVRTNGTQLELWQSGFQLFEKIPVYIAQDGTFSAVLFDGNYKLVRLSGAPWENQTDTINVQVKGNTVIDVDVKPYFTVSNASYSKSGNTLTANFQVSKISENAQLDNVKVYLGKSVLTDQNKSEASVDVDLSEYVPVTGNVNMTQAIEIPSSLAGYPYIFSRVGVKSSQSNEYYYTQVEKIELK